MKGLIIRGGEREIEIEIERARARARTRASERERERERERGVLRANLRNFLRGFFFL